MGSSPTKRRYSPAMERNILACYYRANADDMENGLSWYGKARSVAGRLADDYGIEINQAIGVIAALSPGREWQRNIADATILISEYTSGIRGKRLSYVGTYGRRNVVKATLILQSKDPLDVLGGFKVRSFYSNIEDPANDSPVTIDRHAKCCAYGIKNSANSIVRDSEYEYIAEHFRRAANKIGLVPNQLQSIAWVAWRRLNGNLSQYDLDLGLEGIEVL